MKFPFRRRDDSDGSDVPEADDSRKPAADDSGKPAADDSRKPDSPTQITKPSWVYVMRASVREFSADGCTDLAAGLTYRTIM